MVARDLVVTPLFLFFIYTLAYMLRGRLTTPQTRRFYFMALHLKVIGAIAVGLVYQFYYKGGDTLNYFHHGVEPIFNAFMDSPGKALRIIFGPITVDPELLKYTRQVWSYTDPHSFFVVRVASFFSLFTFKSYSAIAVLFAYGSFMGMWAMYSNFQRIVPGLTREIAVAILFLPSVFFWGSGLLKDTITLGALGWATYALLNLVVLRRKQVRSVLILAISLFVVYQVKYI